MQKEMVMLGSVNGKFFVAIDQDTVMVDAVELERIPNPIPVRAEVGGRDFQELLVGYRHKELETVFVTFEQFDAFFS